MSSISCLQLNMHHALLANVHLVEYLVVEHSIAFITEPYTAFGKIVATPSGYSVFPHLTCTPPPRAGLLVPSAFQPVFLETLSSRDLVVAQVSFAQHTYVLASFYSDITSDFFQPCLQTLIDFVNQHDYRLIFCADTNAHSTLLGDCDNNSRGDEFEEFVLRNSLYVENVGTTPTFETVRGDSLLTSFIDATLTLNVPNLVDWHVSRDQNYSDHNNIHFRILDQVDIYKETRNWKTIRWDIFAERLESLPTLPEYMTKHKICLLYTSDAADE